MDDAIRAGILSEEDIPNDIALVLGSTKKERLDFLIKNIIMNSKGKNDITMSEDAFKAMLAFRKFMFDNLYFNSSCKTQEGKAESMLVSLYDYYLENANELPSDIISLMDRLNIKPKRAVCDYISGMTDYYSVAVFKDLFVPEFWGN